MLGVLWLEGGGAGVVDPGMALDGASDGPVTSEAPLEAMNRGPSGGLVLFQVLTAIMQHPTNRTSAMRTAVVWPETWNTLLSCSIDQRWQNSRVG